MANGKKRAELGDTDMGFWEDIRQYLYVFGGIFLVIGFFFTMAKFLWETSINNSLMTMLGGGMTLIVAEVLRRLIHEKRQVGRWKR